MKWNVVVPVKKHPEYGHTGIEKNARNFENFKGKSTNNTKKYPINYFMVKIDSKPYFLSVGS